MNPRLRLSSSTITLLGRLSFAWVLACMFFLSGEALAVPGGGATRPCPRTDDLDFNAATDVHAFEEYENVIADLLKQEKFVELDCIATSVRSSQARFSGGARKLHKLYGGLSEPQPGQHVTEEDWRNHLRRLEHWSASNPESITARVALAKSYVNYAWDARGNGYSDTVSESGWKLMAKRMDKAKEILDRASSLHEKCPEWYVVMQQVARGQDWTPDQIEQLFQKAVAFDPGFEVYYRLRAVDLLPKWGGAEGESSHFAEEVSDHLGGKAGDMLYFQIATEIFCPCTDPEFKHLSWPRLQKGFEAMQSAYGDSLYNWNMLALMASKNQDLIAADAAFKHVGEQWDKATWITADWFHQQKEIAASFAPLEASRRAAKQEAEANLQTPEGSSYKKEFDIRFAKLEQTCIEKNRDDLTSVEFFLKIGKAGTADDARMKEMTKIVQCLMQELGEAHFKNTVLFPMPPHDGYWMRIAVDPSEDKAAAK